MHAFQDDANVRVRHVVVDGQQIVMLMPARVAEIALRCLNDDDRSSQEASDPFVVGTMTASDLAKLSLSASAQNDMLHVRRIPPTLPNNGA